MCLLGQTTPTQEGIKVGGSTVNVRFADDQAMVAATENRLQES